MRRRGFGRIWSGGGRCGRGSNHLLKHGVIVEYEISAVELKSLKDGLQEFTLLDVREPWEYQTARIEGSRHIPMGDVPARFNQEFDPEQHIVVVCHHGVRSMNVTAWLRQQGFEKVQSLRGGIDRWSREVDPGVPLY
jgi:rhodanese-related sulfurtransferase